MRIGIAGVTGRMGRALLEYGLNSSSSVWRLSVGMGRSIQKMNDFITLYTSADRQSRGTIKFTSEFEEFIESCDVVLDFTAPTFTLLVAHACAKCNKALVSGTTGFSEEQYTQLNNLARSTRIFLSPNMCIGINILGWLIAKTASMLDTDFDAEITELHHKHKRDIPSGTAMMLASAITRGRKNTLGIDSNICVGRNASDDSQRNSGAIYISSLRGGGAIGDHSVIFSGNAEIIQIEHRTLSREVFAIGAYKAAEYLTLQKVGKVYNMSDLLGISNY
ncbi:4-hydroxy-tetrahydrodipicolinate reductase [Alphaproteobacteria bacterium]